MLRPVAVGALIFDPPFLAPPPPSGAKATLAHSRHLEMLPMDIKTKYMVINPERKPEGKLGRVSHLFKEHSEPPQRRNNSFSTHYILKMSLYLDFLMYVCRLLKFAFFSLPEQ